MSTSSSAKRRQFWRSDGFVGAVVVLLVLVLHKGTDAIGTLERRFYDLGVTSSARSPSDQVAIIAIDDPSIAALGRWPWPRDLQAQLIDKLVEGRAKTIVETVLFSEPQTDRALGYIRKIRDALGPAADQNEALARLMAEAEGALDADARLAASMAKAGNVLLPAVFDLGIPQGNPDKPLPASVAKNALDDRSGYGLPVLRGQFPIDPLGNAAAGVGHLTQRVDLDGAVRQDILMVDYYGKAVPSLALLAVARSLKLGPADLRLDPAGDSVSLGRLRIRTGDGAFMYPQFYGARDGRPAFARDSFYDVVSGKIPASRYTGKIVLVGVTAAGVGTLFPVPGNPGVAPVELMAHVVSSILNEQFIVEPGWSRVLAALAFLLVGLYLVALLPRLPTGRGAGVSAGLFMVLLCVEFFLLTGSALWIELVAPAGLLLIGQLALTAKRFLVTEAGTLPSDRESAETSRMMGMALQGQGQLDMAFDRFRHVPMGEAVMENLYNLALDFERKRQFNKAQAVYEHMAAHDAHYKDLQEKLARVKNLSETVLLGGGGAHPGGALLLKDGQVEKPMLGRYQVEKELGKGAMGIVYQGRDPKIGRVVAIKTMALSQEFEGDELADARERFFREAETAGRLQHQNIVTIFDAGEEHDLAYIAMEFLKGRDLVDFCRSPQLLPVPKVVSIVARVAEALAYAHRQNVVHRDIKPANIMYEPASDTVKVTDFGIARITDSSKTKTGLVLGTPSFMSPEQIAGKKVDGRSDLYSLGVMLYQMLTGVLPFRGESMAELMYKIANEPAPDIRVLRPEIPERLANIVTLALSKRAETRYQDGDQFAADLRTVLAELGGATGAGPDAAAPTAHPPGVPASPFDATVAAPAMAAGPAAHVATRAVAAPADPPVQGYDAPAPAAVQPPGGYQKTEVKRRPPGDPGMGS
ncbi:MULTISPECIES: serine/threonine-protein kinase [Ramlibacter]|uniref:CHASE2 domain-containing protein n=1 Tax=Ramlibacter aquaticus TaxID=2780094 RepID=A0ABR9SAW5_9BURK|nr:MULTISPECIES: serine/threonine-protein kinase [Ramlibacter]MBE7939440.1 CHASE2 domain-containing protein [Ramlibacter aquaticus]